MSMHYKVMLTTIFESQNRIKIHPYSRIQPALENSLLSQKRGPRNWG
jgi:hypothetical protein